MIDATVAIEVGDAIGRQGPIHHVDLTIAVDVLRIAGGDPIQMIDLAIAIEIGQSPGIVLVVNTGHRMGHGLDVRTGGGTVRRRREGSQIVRIVGIGQIALVAPPGTVVAVHSKVWLAPRCLARLARTAK